MKRILPNVAVTKGAYGKASLIPLALLALLFIYAFFFPALWSYFDTATPTIFDYTYTASSNSPASRALLDLFLRQEFDSKTLAVFWVFMIAPVIWAASFLLQNATDNCNERPAHRLYSRLVAVTLSRAPLQLFIVNLGLLNIFLAGILSDNAPRRIIIVERVAIKLREFIIIRRVGSITAA